MARVGLAFLLLAALGECLAAIFDINNNVGHNAPGAFGILGLPVAAMLLSIGLTRLPEWRDVRYILLVTANLTWVSIVLLAASFALFVASYSASGAPMNGQVPQSLPHGVIAFLGWADRLVIIVYATWAMILGWQAATRRT